MAIIVAYSNSGITSGKKLFATSKWRPFWKCPNIKHSFNLTPAMKNHPKLCKKKYFHSDGVFDDVTEWPQSRFSIFLYEWWNDIFHDNYRTTKDIIFKLSTHMYHWIVNMRLQAILECFVDDVIRSQNKSKLWTTIALSKFELEKRSTAQNIANWIGYQKLKFQFHIQISKFWQVRNLRLPFHLFVCLSVTSSKQVTVFYTSLPNLTQVCIYVA